MRVFRFILRISNLQSECMICDSYALILCIELPCDNDVIRNTYCTYVYHT